MVGGLLNRLISQPKSIEKKMLGPIQVFIRAGFNEKKKKKKKKIWKLLVLGNASSPILRLRLVMNLLHLRLTAFTLYFYKLLT